jgi:hypothetical protein
MAAGEWPTVVGRESMCQPKKKRRVSLGFSKERVEEGQHICYLYNDDRERLSVLAKYLESGRLDGEKILYLVDTMTPEKMLSELASLGLDTRARPEAFSVAEAKPAYCAGGAFDADRILQIVKEFYIQAVEREGYSGARSTGEMSWCLDAGMADLTPLMEYEARLNELLAECPCTACCQYDTRRFSGAAILDVLSVHPLAIVRGQLVKNPFYVTPQAFLDNLRAREPRAGQ